MSGYSATPLLKKLGIKTQMSIYIYHPPEHYFDLLGELPDGVLFFQPEDQVPPLDFVHLFCESIAELEEIFESHRDSLKKEGMLWVSWKKAIKGKNPTDLNENRIRDTALSLGMVDVKVCAVDDTWSGLKMVFRLKDRK